MGKQMYAGLQSRVVRKPTVQPSTKEPKKRRIEVKPLTYKQQYQLRQKIQDLQLQHDAVQRIAVSRRKMTDSEKQTLQNIKIKLALLKRQSGN